MKYSEMLDKYTKDYERYVNMGLTMEEAIVLIEYHIKNDINLKTMSPYNLINLLAGEDVIGNIFSGFEKELDTLHKKINDAMVEHKCECKCHEKKEEAVPAVKEEQVEKEVIADTPNHKEFRVTYPNGYFTYKMLMK